MGLLKLERDPFCGITACEKLTNHICRKPEKYLGCSGEWSQTPRSKRSADLGNTNE